MYIASTLVASLPTIFCHALGNISTKLPIVSRYCFDQPTSNISSMIPIDSQPLAVEYQPIQGSTSKPYKRPSLEELNSFVSLHFRKTLILFLNSNNVKYFPNFTLKESFPMHRTVSSSTRLASLFTLQSRIQSATFSKSFSVVERSSIRLILDQVKGERKSN